MSAPTHVLHSYNTAAKYSTRLLTTKKLHATMTNFAANLHSDMEHSSRRHSPLLHLAAAYSYTHRRLANLHSTFSRKLRARFYFQTRHCLENRCSASSRKFPTLFYVPARKRFWNYVPHEQPFPYSHCHTMRMLQIGRTEEVY